MNTTENEKVESEVVEDVKSESEVKEIETERDAFEFMNEEFRKYGIPEFDLTNFKD